MESAVGRSKGAGCGGAVPFGEWCDPSLAEFLDFPERLLQRQLGLHERSREDGAGDAGSGFLVLAEQSIGVGKAWAELGKDVHQLGGDRRRSGCLGGDQPEPFPKTRGRIEQSLAGLMK